MRGLRIATQGSDRAVKVADSDPALWVTHDHLPNIAIVRFDPSRGTGPVQRLLGTGGEGHAVVVHSRASDGRWLVADPAVGWRYWSNEELQRVFTGEEIYLGASKTPR